jgi:hypothetical protein
MFSTWVNIVQILAADAIQYYPISSSAHTMLLFIEIYFVHFLPEFCILKESRQQYVLSAKHLRRGALISIAHSETLKNPRHGGISRRGFRCIHVKCIIYYIRYKTSFFTYSTFGCMTTLNICRIYNIYTVKNYKISNKKDTLVYTLAITCASIENLIFLRFITQ